MPRPLAKILAVTALVFLFGSTIGYLAIVISSFISMLFSTASK